MDALYETGKLLAGPANGDRLFSPVLNVLSSFLDLRHGVVALLEDPSALEERPDVSGTNPYRIAATTASEIPLPPDCGALPVSVAQTVLRTGIPMMIQNVASEFGGDAVPSGLSSEAEAGSAALLATPISAPGPSPLTTGVLAAYRIAPGDAPIELDYDLRLLSMVATLMGQAIRFRRMVARDRALLMDEAKRLDDARSEAAQFNAPAGAARGTAAKPHAIIGESDAIRAVCAQIQKVAPTKATVLLRGESGTGKELFARALHEDSDRRDKPFVKVNCAALSESLLESELFGHEKGAFTGAAAQKKGRFELADGGTLFLDEIGEISASFQAKLLRALQEGEFERVGGAKTIRVDVRLVAATNKDLEEAVANGDFRADLYFRICVVPIVLPPLRERPDDIPRLAKAFLDRFNRENGARLRFAAGATDILARCGFPGNVRELENCVNRVATLSSGPTITAQDLACQQDACLSAQLWRRQAGAKAPVGGLAAAATPSPSPSMPLPLVDSRAPGGFRQNCPPADCPGRAAESAPTQGSNASEREALIAAMEKAGWVQAKAGRMLGLTPRQIGYALKKHGVALKKI